MRKCGGKNKVKYSVTLVSSPSSSVINIFSPSLDVTLETVTYNCLWENTGVGRYTPTCLSDCPWLLLIVIANDTVKGNCLRWNLKRIQTSEGDRDSLDTKTWLPTLLPEMTLPSMRYLPILVITNLVPLHNPYRVPVCFFCCLCNLPRFKFFFLEEHGLGFAIYSRVCMEIRVAEFVIYHGLGLFFFYL